MQEHDTVFSISHWSEQDIHRDAAIKIARVDARKTYSGPMNGESFLAYTLFYTDDAHSYFVGFEHFTGTIHGKKGSLSFELKGTFANATIEEVATVLEDSGTHELADMKGHMSLHSGIAEQDLPVRIELS